MDDRDRAAPVALAADAPVAQTELGTRGAQFFLDQRDFDSVEGAREVQAVELAGIDQRAVLAVGVLPWRRVAVTGAGAHHGFDRQVVFVGEFEIALVVGRNRHDRTVAVMHQHVVGDPYR
ncbi:hypothetical protein D3C81_1379510 [compost metagenome]